MPQVSKCCFKRHLGHKLISLSHNPFFGGPPGGSPPFLFLCFDGCQDKLSNVALAKRGFLVVYYLVRAVIGSAAAISA
jgi:hypothetical protein